MLITFYVLRISLPLPPKKYVYLKYYLKLKLISFRSRSSKKRAPGEGVLMLRSKLPPPAQFIDCYQKFKFAFNCIVSISNIKRLQ